GHSSGSPRALYFYPPRRSSDLADAASLPDVIAQCSTNLPAAPTATDACEGAIAGVADVSGPFGQGDHAITWTFTDSHGNSSTRTPLVNTPELTAPTDNAASLPH